MEIDVEILIEMVKIIAKRFRYFLHTAHNLFFFQKSTPLHCFVLVESQLTYFAILVLQTRFYGFFCRFNLGEKIPQCSYARNICLPILKINSSGCPSNSSNNVKLTGRFEMAFLVFTQINRVNRVGTMRLIS